MIYTFLESCQLVIQLICCFFKTLSSCLLLAPLIAPLWLRNIGKVLIYYSFFLNLACITSGCVAVSFAIPVLDGWRKWIKSSLFYALKLNLSGSSCCVLEGHILMLSSTASHSFCVFLCSTTPLPPNHNPPPQPLPSSPSTSPLKPAAGWGLPSSGLETQQGGRALDPA